MVAAIFRRMGSGRQQPGWPGPHSERETVLRCSPSGLTTLPLSPWTKKLEHPLSPFLPFSPHLSPSLSIPPILPSHFSVYLFLHCTPTPSSKHIQLSSTTCSIEWYQHNAQQWPAHVCTSNCQEKALLVLLSLGNFMKIIEILYGWVVPPYLAAQWSLSHKPWLWCCKHPVYCSSECPVLQDTLLWSGGSIHRSLSGVWCHCQD